MGFARTSVKVLSSIFASLVLLLIAVAYHASIFPLPATEADIIASGGVPVRHKDGRLTEVFEGGSKDGVPFLLIHGFMCDGRMLVGEAYNEEWKKLNIRVIAPSLPGHSLSTLYPDRKLVDYPLDVQDILDHFGITGKFYVAGFSFGGQHAAVTAAYFADRVIAAGLLGPVAPPELAADVDYTASTTDRVMAILFRTPLIRDLLSKVSAAQPYYDFCANVPALDHFNKHATPQYVTAFREAAARAFAWSHIGYIRGGVDVIGAPWGFDFRSGLAKLKNLYFVYGTKETLLPVVLSQHFATQLPQHTVIETVADDHMYLVTDLARLVARVVELGSR